MTHISAPIIYTATRLESIANRYVFYPMGTSSTSIKILGLLKKKRIMIPREILELVGGTKSNISQRLKKLEKIGLIEKTYALFSDDKRKVAIKLTINGNKKLQEVIKRLKKANIALESHFTQKELSEFTKFIAKINTTLDNKEDHLKEVFDN